MNPKSAKTLAWLAGIQILLALVILSPSGAFALLVLAAACAAIPAVFASGWSRLSAAVLLMASIALAATFYPAFERDRETYIQRSKGRASGPQAATPIDQGR